MIDESEVWLIGVALIAVITSIGFGIWSNLNTRKSNELLEDQLQITTRPWVSISALSGYKVKSRDQVMDYAKFRGLSKKRQEKFQPIEFMYICYFENTGLLSTNITYSSTVGVDEITKENLQYIEMTEKTEIILPKQTIPRILFVPYSLIQNIENIPVFMAVRIEYQFKDKKNEIKEEKIRKIWKLTKQGIHSREIW